MYIVAVFDQAADSIFILKKPSDVLLIKDGIQVAFTGENIDGYCTAEVRRFPIVGCSEENHYIICLEEGVGIVSTLPYIDSLYMAAKNENITENISKLH